MRFRTENSLYEVDFANTRIRRLEGVADPTPRQGEDGVWKKFVSLIPVLADNDAFAFFIDWDGERHGTFTSNVKEITEDEDENTDARV